MYHTIPELFGSFIPLDNEQSKGIDHFAYTLGEYANGDEWKETKLE
ncbi:hypothetical protein [Bacteroides acidifaciens]|nr:hypothetical protein [Bacteroides acidifaciens]